MKRLLLGISLLFCGAQLMAQVPAYVPTAGLAAWYNFDGDYLDASGNNNHLTTSGTANRTTDRFGNANSAFAASTAGHLTNVAPSFTLNPTQSYSFSLWVNRTAGTVAFMIGIAGSGSFITNFQMGGTTVNAQFGTNRQGQAWFWAQAAAQSNVWNHYVCVYDAPNMFLYENGQLIGTNTYTHTGATSQNNPLWIGRGVSGGNFVGSIDEVGFWNRVLSTAEIQQLYAGCSAGFSTQPQSASVFRSSNHNLIANGLSAATARQWQMDTGNGFADISPSARFSGTQSDTLRILGVDFDLNQAAFRCINSDSLCADTSDVAVLSVNCSQLIENHPLPQSGRMNETATFTVSSYDSLANYQWQRNTGGGFVDLVNGADISGANSSTLTLSNLQLSQDGENYRCLVFRAPCGDTSVVAVLTVINTTSVGEQALTALKVYPNPASDAWTVHLPENSAHLAYQLLDLQGRLLQKGAFEPGINLLSADGLASGHYLLEVANHTKMRLIKQ
ncbi:MAG: LamG-like jellyroll fold domain-containing protein [Bacteroidia bacterium]